MQKSATYQLHAARPAKQDHPARQTKSFVYVTNSVVILQLQYHRWITFYGKSTAVYFLLTFLIGIAPIPNIIHRREN